MRRHVSRAGARAGEVVAVTAESTAACILTLIGLWESGVVAWLRAPAARDGAALPHRWHVGTPLPAPPPGVASVSFDELTAPLPASPREPVSIGPFATLVSSAGSEGTPKIVAHTLDHHVASARGFLDAFPFGAPDGWLLRLPLHHVGGLAVLFRTAYAGATLRLPDAGVPIETDIARQAPTHVSVVPTQLDRLLRSPSAGRSLRLVLVGGAPVSDRLRQAAVDAGAPVVVSYGLTEMASIVAATGEPAFVRTTDMAGGVLPGREVRVDADGSVLVRGTSLFAGYVGAGGAVDPCRTGDGWFRTGDAGSLTEAGHVLIHGRRDFVFITGGENVHPEEIENVLLDHPSVDRAIVVAVPDDTFGQRPVAFVESQPGARVRADALRAHCRERLAAFKAPDRFYRLPESTALKPDRRSLQRLATRADPNELHNLG